MADNIEGFLASYSPDVQALAQHLRTLIKSALPDALETLAADTHIAYAFAAASAEQIVYMTPMRNHVRLNFPHGSQLPDPNHLLLGEGRWLRNIKIRTLAQANRPALSHLLFAAYNDAKAQLTLKKPYS